MDTKSPYQAQEALPLPQSGRRRRGGQIERAIVRATNAARRDGILTDLQGPLIALARTAAASVDLAAQRGDAYAVAQGGRQLADYLAKLGLVSTVGATEPAASGNDQLAELLAAARTPGP